MRALVQPEFGDPTEVLSVQEVPDPEPGPGQALVRVLLSPIHNHDLWTVRGSYGFKPGMPARAGTGSRSSPTRCSDASARIYEPPRRSCMVRPSGSLIFWPWEGCCNGVRPVCVA